MERRWVLLVSFFVSYFLPLSSFFLLCFHFTCIEPFIFLFLLNFLLLFFVVVFLFCFVLLYFPFLVIFPYVFSFLYFSVLSLLPLLFSFYSCVFSSFFLYRIVFKTPTPHLPWSMEMPFGKTLHSSSLPPSIPLYREQPSRFATVHAPANFPPLRKEAALFRLLSS